MNTNRLNPNDVLNLNDQIVAANGRTRMVMQGDGNLVIYRNDTGAAVWATGTNGSGATHAVMQGDGNLVLYDGETGAKWATGTDLNPGAYAVLEDAGDLQISNVLGAQLWTSPEAQFGHIAIPPQHKKWEQDYYGIASLDYDPSTRLAVIHQDITNTFKLAGVTIGLRVLYYGADGHVIGSQDWQTYCPQAPLFGAAHESKEWTLTAPEGTQGFALVQYYHRDGLAALGDKVEEFLNDVVGAVGNGVDAAGKWCEENPNACAAIAMSVIIIAGTALCVLAGPAAITCEVVFVFGVS